MGIDAEMFVRVRRAVPDDEVRSLRIALGDAFGADKFWIFNREDGKGKEAPLDDDPDSPFGEGRHSIERTNRYTQDGDDIVPLPGETFLRVYPASRYYGPGYERGDLPFLLMLARFLRDKTGGEVWYGGDSSGVCAKLLDQAAEDKLWAHFVEHSHNPYNNVILHSLDNFPVQHCSFCNHPMVQYSFGGSRCAAFCCMGCNANIRTEDGGATWQPVKDPS